MLDNETTPLKLKNGDALIIVDAQNDFLPGGNLAVPRGDEVIPVLNRCIPAFLEHGLPIYATRDWHPPDHCSFQAQGGPWPVHCVAESVGARFAPGLNLPSLATVISKGDRPGNNAYSGFAGTDLDERLRSNNVKRLFVGGLATDYCVLSTVKDALARGYCVCLIEDAVRAVNARPDDGRNAIAEMQRGGCRIIGSGAICLPAPATPALLTDYYQLAMMQGYFDRGMIETAVFEFFVRRLPSGRGFLLAAGLEQVIEYLENLRFADSELDWLERRGRFKKEFVETLAELRFTGDADAMPEGTIFFAEEPILRITAPLPQAQFVETRIINLLQYQTLTASKAARSVLAAPGKTLIDFGCRRAHGAEAGLMAARASYIAGFAGSATVWAGALFGIPLFGTMAHSFIQAHDDEARAFENFARSHPGNVVLLLDTYDTEEAARKTALLAKRLRAEGIKIRGVRLDSGDIVATSKKVRGILDAAGFKDIRIYASGNLDEYALRGFAGQNAPIDGFGIGTLMTVSADAPYLDCVYKLQEYAGRARRKLSEGKTTWPGRKQVFRKLGADGKMIEDYLTLEGEACDGDALLEPVMRQGRRIAPPVPLEKSRKRAEAELARLPQHLRDLKTEPAYPVKISAAVRELAEKSISKRRGKKGRIKGFL